MEPLAELIDFLRDPKPEVRKLAVQGLTEYCAQEDLKDILFSSEKLIPNLFYLLSDNNSIQKDALLCILQLSTKTDFCYKFVERRIISRIMEFINDPSNIFVQIYCLILSNVTRLDKASMELLQIGTDFEGLYIGKLLEKFCMPIDPIKKVDSFQWLANVFTNVTQLDEGKKLFADPSHNIISALLPYLSHSNPVRKRGISSTIRNCCFDGDLHDWLINSLSIFSYLITPLVVPGNYSDEEIAAFPICVKDQLAKNQKEEDVQTKRDLLDTIVILTMHKQSRNTLRSLEIYPIIRELDHQETDESVKEVLVKIVEMIIRDEESEKKIVELEELEEETVN